MTMKKTTAVLIALLMCFSVMPAAGFADDNRALTEITGYEQKLLTEDYLEKSFIDLYDEGKLTVSKDMTAETETDGKGLLFTAKASVFSDGKIRIAGNSGNGKIDFDGNAVARITVDGLAARKTNAAVNIYIDDEEEPVTSIQLKAQPKEGSWTRDGKISQTIIGKGLKGEHDVYFTISFEGIDETKKTSVLLRSIEFAEGSIPVMDFHIDESLGTIAEMNASENHSAECYGEVDIMVPEEFDCEFTEGKAESVKGLDLEYLRGRGNSTWEMDKKPYKVKFEKGQDLLGMGTNKHWTLLANRFDNSLIRNRITYWLTRELGKDTGVYAIRCVPVEVVMNGRYYGSYLLAEQVRAGKNRVDIDDLEDMTELSDPDDIAITGGYLLSRGFGEDNDDQNIITERNEAFFIESPGFEKHTDEAKAAQKKYIQDYVRKVENAIYGDGFRDSSGKGYAEYLDVDSTVDYWWVQEFTQNGDAYKNSSTYLYKPRDTEEKAGKLYWGPLWDFDYVAWGDLEYECDPPEIFNYAVFSWMSKLRTDPVFLEKLRTRWKKIDSLLDEMTKDGGVIERYADEVGISQQYDNALWGFYTEDNEGGEPIPEITYNYEIDWLRRWIEKRRAWINQDGQLDKLEARTCKVDFAADDKIIETQYILEDEYCESFPEAPEKKGMTFIGWTDEEGNVIDEKFQVAGDRTITAMYVDSRVVSPIKDIFFKEQDIYEHYYTSDEEQQCLEIVYTTYPKYGIGKIAWSSSDENVIHINEDGDFEVKGAGTSIITATLPTGKQSSFTVHILEDTVLLDSMESFTLDRESLTLESGAYTQILINKEPSPCDSTSFSWISADSEIASVDECGVVTANNPGTTYVIALETDLNIYRRCKVTVTMNKEQKIDQAGKAKTSLKAKALKGHKVKLTWKKASGVSGYYILRADKKNGKYRKVKVIKKAGVKKWTQKKLRKGKKYYYKIRPFTRISGKIYKGKLSKAVKVKAK